MKKFLMGMVLMGASAFSNAAGYMGFDGIYYANICRDGYYYWVMPRYAPYGMGCYFYYNGFKHYGTVSDY